MITLNAVAPVALPQNTLASPIPVRFAAVRSPTLPGWHIASAGAVALVRVRRRAGKELPLPPGKFGNAFLDLVKYIKDPDAYIGERVKLYGPIFQTNYFGRKTVIVGRSDLVLDFVEVEKKITKSALPNSFSQLHTEYGTMNQAGATHRSTRSNLISGALCEDAFAAFLPTIQRRCEELVTSVASRKRMALAKELKDWSVRLFSELFTGEQFEDKFLKQLYLYNEGLFGLVPLKLPFTAFGRGFKAKDELVEMLKQRVEALQASGDIEKPQYAVLRRLSNSKDENDQVWSTEHVAHSAVISVWGAYVEVASILANALHFMSKDPQICKKAFKEVGGDLQKSEYLQAILDECLRLKPPAGGGFRLAEEDLVIGGYRVPKGYVVSADPRISNMDKEIHKEPAAFNPGRFIERPTRQLPKGSWFPGGVGLHGCPGIPLAMLVSKVFLGTWLRCFDSWGPAANSKEEWVPIPIRILSDKYEVTVSQRAD